MEEVKKPLLVSVGGPTAVGKTSLAIALAKHFQTEILSVDSRQVYKEMSVGTAKPTADELSQVNHFFIDSHSIHEYFSVGLYEREAVAHLQVAFEKNPVIIAVGGSGLFFDALWYGLDQMPEVELGVREELNQEFQSYGLPGLLEELKQKDPVYYEVVDRNNHQRVIRALEVIRTSGKPFSSFRRKSLIHRPWIDVKVGLRLEREELYARINLRVDQMMEEGLLDEVKVLYPYRALNALQTVGYSEMFPYLAGEYDLEEAIRLLKRNTRRYAKRQLTWFGRYEDVVWHHPEDLQAIVRMVEEQLSNA